VSILAARIGLNYQIIIETAAQIADETGLERVTLTAVAQRLGVRKPSLYNHVDGLAELKRGLAIWGTYQLRSRISEAAIGQAKEDAILAIAMAYRAFAHQRPGLYRAIVVVSDHGHPDMNLATGDLMAVLSAVMSSYKFNEKDKTHAVRGLRSIMHGFVTLEAAGWFASIEVDREESYHQLIRTFLRGMETQ
jgi:AcrR family transcriptional regulator